MSPRFPAYTLPDVLGKAHDAKSWNTRRAEIVEIYRKEVFGARPGALENDFEATGQVRRSNGKATRKIVSISFGSGPKMHMLVYVPAGAKKPSPVFLGLNFGPIHTVANDPGVPLGEEWVRDPKRRRW